jgi:hypothetical protein
MSGVWALGYAKPRLVTAPPEVTPVLVHLLKAPEDPLARVMVSFTRLAGWHSPRCMQMAPTLKAWLNLKLLANP